MQHSCLRRHSPHLQTNDCQPVLVEHLFFALYSLVSQHHNVMQSRVQKVVVITAQMASRTAHCEGWFSNPQTIHHVTMIMVSDANSMDISLALKNGIAGKKRICTTGIFSTQICMEPSPAITQKMVTRSECVILCPHGSRYTSCPNTATKTLCDICQMLSNIQRTTQHF